jgi:two-component system phosphate regulon response regulator OmpR
MKMIQSSLSILIADGDTRHGQLLKQYFQAEGFQAFVAKDADEVRAFLNKEKPSLLVLDRFLPDAGGAVFCQELRQQGFSFPVIMLLGKGDDTRTFVNAKVGVNACVRKTLTPLRVLAKIQEVMDLTSANKHASSAQEAEQAQSIAFGEFVFDLRDCSLRKNGKEIPLTKGDCSMLRALALRPHQLIEREALSLLARGRMYQPFDRSLDVQLSRLRKLIEDDNRNPRYLQTVWGSGYMFVPDGKRQTDKITKDAS